MACLVTTYDGRIFECPHPETMDCAECRQPHCQIHVAECPACGEVVCQDCWQEHRREHGFREVRRTA